MQPLGQYSESSQQSGDGEVPDAQERGAQMTRLETFVDAAFAFSLTMLVISFDAIPQSFDEFIIALRNIPSFAVSFAQIALFWYAHNKWSRTYGLDDMPTTLLGLALVFTVLVFVYPLRVIFSGFFTWVSAGYFPFAFTNGHSAENMAWMFVIYGLAFAAMSANIAMHYWYAFRCRQALRLTAIERYDTRWMQQTWIVLTSVGVICALFAWLAPASSRVYSGFIFASLAVIMPVFSAFKGRERRRLFNID